MFTFDPGNKDFIATLEFLLKIVGGGGAFYLFWIGLLRYRKDQIWKRNEFVAKEIKEFTADRIVKIVMCILDWGNRYVELFPGKANYDDRFVRFDHPAIWLLRHATFIHRPWKRYPALHDYRNHPDSRGQPGLCVNTCIFLHHG